MFYRKARIRKRPRTTEVSMEKLGAPRCNAYCELANAAPLSSTVEYRAVRSLMQRGTRRWHFTRPPPPIYHAATLPSQRTLCCFFYSFDICPSAYLGSSLPSYVRVKGSGTEGSVRSRASNCKNISYTLRIYIEYM